ncbi:uncharacterized protein LOC116734525 isoform X6 [Xiphophorus hellerii]|uniref:uncharacterized protein LOC116734525 isoform X6 n=1 Tax=Xiphophorus hellerii TaxID=8084 RepID=UPI0013B3FB53|nr:uncharacterized protein LOC116734525 isoform X6 [Xiphophorus hellerii]
MAAFRWIQMVLLLILMIQFKAQTETQQTFLTVRDGNEVTLPCGNRRDTQDKSDNTIWVFNNKHKSETRKLVKLESSHREMKTISDRLSVTANGSLLLHKVTEVDAGRYTCHWIKSRQLHDFVVYLSVITIVEQEKPDKVALFCSVVFYDYCRHEVKWLYEGTEEKPSDMEIYQHSCSDSVTFPTSHQKLNIYPSLTCKVTNSVTNAVQLIPFSLQSSGKEVSFHCCKVNRKQIFTVAFFELEVTQSTPTATHHWTFAGSNKEVKQQDIFYLLRWIVVSVGLAALVISVVILNLLLKTKGNKKQNEQNLECNHEDEDEGVEIYEN